MPARSRFANIVFISVSLSLAAVSGAATTAAVAAEADKAPQVANPVDDFNRAVVEAKKSLGDLSSKIEESSKQIEGLTSTEAARAQVAELQSLIADALGQVADNGKVMTLGQKVVDYARSKEALFDQDTKFSAEERQFLLKEWRRIETEAKRATDDLGSARREFTELLRQVQARSDYIEELQALNNAQQMLDVIKKLAGEVRAASGSMKSLIQSVTAPAPGI
ncbi:MAG: hypothetical protein P4L98_14095 [Ancalomicrobiaceae bacterium]|nr:hypothetical protein [Ancalomicrobiaceae bacterium]